jgi:hypothetical protein
MINPIGNFGIYDGRLNGIDTMIMDSSQNADNVINDFEKAFMAGMNPNNLLTEILDNRNLTVNDFTDQDIQRVNRKVEQIYKTVDYEAWRQR